MSWETAGLLGGGFIFLVLGGELLVRGASRLAAAAGVSPLVIGLTVVSFGTSAPELAVSIQAGIQGSADLAVANVVGSNIFNILFTAGLCALLVPLVVDQQLVRLDVPVLVGVSLFSYVLALDGRLTRLEGALLFAGILAYTFWGIRQSRRETQAVQEEYAREYGREALPATRRAGDLLLQLGLLVAGLVVLVLGSGWLVEGATTLARSLGISEVVIGLTIISIGTSLPEVATSLIATVRGERDIAIGNVIGSNIFNLLCILGAAGMLTPGGLNVAASLLRVDLLIMIGVAIACVPIFLKGTIARWEGGVFLLSYALYTTYLVLNASDSPARDGFSNLLLTYGLPLLTLLVLIAGWQAIRGFQMPGRESAGGSPAGESPSAPPS